MLYEVITNLFGIFLCGRDFHRRVTVAGKGEGRLKNLGETEADLKRNPLYVAGKIWLGIVVDRLIFLKRLPLLDGKGIFDEGAGVFILHDLHHAGEGLAVELRDMMQEVFFQLEQ